MGALRRLRLLGPAAVEIIPRSRPVPEVEQEPEVAGQLGQDQAATTFKAPRFRSKSTIALLGYLVSERRPIGRERLALLF